MPALMVKSDNHLIVAIKKTEEQTDARQSDPNKLLC